MKPVNKLLLSLLLQFSVPAHECDECLQAHVSLSPPTRILFAVRNVRSMVDLPPEKAYSSAIVTSPAVASDSAASSLISSVSTSLRFLPLGLVTGLSFSSSASAVVSPASSLALRLRPAVVFWAPSVVLRLIWFQRIFAMPPSLKPCSLATASQSHYVDFR
jgi:hypothetical protein